MKTEPCLIPLPLFWEENTNKEFTYIDIPTLDVTLRNKRSQREVIFYFDDFFWKTNMPEQAYDFITSKIAETLCPSINAVGIISPPFNLNGYFRARGSVIENLVPVSEEKFKMNGYKRVDLDDSSLTRKVYIDEYAKVTFVDPELENRMIAWALFEKYAKSREIIWS